MTRPEDRRLIVFRSRLNPGVDADYAPHAERMYQLAQSMPGFVSSADFVAEDGERLALIEFDSAEQLRVWKNRTEHRAAQAEGRVRYFSQYLLQICCVLRESRFDGGERSATPGPAPAVAVELTGGCACGAVRYVVRGVPKSRTLCHCTDCRKACGATPVAWATFETGDLAFERGTPRERVSSERARRGFCAECGTQLTFAYVAEPGFVDLATATLDELDRIAPDDHTWVRSKPSWLRIGDDLPRYECDRERG